MNLTLSNLTGCVVFASLLLCACSRSYSTRHEETTNIVDNGLGSWLAETNHTFGPTIAKQIFILQHPDGKFYLRFRASTNDNFAKLFESDRPFSSAEDARWALSVNINLQCKKAMCDGMEDAFKSFKP